MAPRVPGGNLTSLLPDAAAAASHWLRKNSSSSTSPRPAAAAAAAASVAAVAAASVVAATRATRAAHTTTTSSPPDGPPSKGPARYERAVSEGLRACARESHAYGRCAAGYLPDAAPRGACEREFAALRRCFLAASGLGGARRGRGGGT